MPDPNLDPEFSQCMRTPGFRILVEKITNYINNILTNNFKSLVRKIGWAFLYINLHWFHIMHFLAMLLLDPAPGIQTNADHGSGYEVGTVVIKLE